MFLSTIVLNNGFSSDNTFENLNGGYFLFLSFVIIFNGIELNFSLFKIDVFSGYNSKSK